MSDKKPTYEQLEQERNELAAQVERFRAAAYNILVNRTGMDEWYDLEKAYHETPSTALAALKAQWQAEYEHCDHQYHYFGDQRFRRCALCDKPEIK